MQSSRSYLRAPLLALALLTLAAGIWSGMQRIGWPLPMPQPSLVALHGPLMVAGALGTIISLERAVALGRRWSYAAPLLHAMGGLLLVVGGPLWLGALLLTLGSLALVVVFGVLLGRQPALFLVVMGLGALALLAGNGLWLAGWPIFSVVWWWAGFLVLTIAGERLELGRLRQWPIWVEALFILLIALLVAGLITTTAAPDIGIRFVHVALVGLALWLLRYDIARRTVRKPGLTRYIAVCLLSGYVWLGVGGLVGTIAGPLYAGPVYDAVLHAVFVGFVFAMIFGHAPIIAPALLGVSVRFRRSFYAPLAFLHASLLLRVVGDLAGIGALRRWGGLLNGVALLLFFAVMVWAARAHMQAERCTHKHASLSAPR